MKSNHSATFKVHQRECGAGGVVGSIFCFSMLKIPIHPGTAIVTSRAPLKRNIGKTCKQQLECLPITLRETKARHARRGHNPSIYTCIHSFIHSTIVTCGSIDCLGSLDCYAHGFAAYRHAEPTSGSDNAYTYSCAHSNRHVATPLAPHLHTHKTHGSQQT